jgi:valacyclovir hydrolase
LSWFEYQDQRIYYEEEGAGQPLLLLPGWGGTIDEFTPLRTKLAERYRVIAADSPGLGRSQPQPRVFTPSYYHEDAATLAAFLESLRLGPAHLTGFSDGGEFALLIAIERPDLVRSVVTWGSAGRILEPVPGMFDAFAALIDAPIEPLREFSESLKRTYGEANARTMVQSAANALRTIAERGGDISLSRAGAIRCPVLLISGEEDMFIPRALVEAAASAIKGAGVIRVPGAGHEVHLSHGDWLASTILDWLAGVRVAA